MEKGWRINTKRERRRRRQRKRQRRSSWRRVGRVKGDKRRRRKRG